MTRTRTVIATALSISVLALGACSADDPEPQFGPTPSTSAPTSPSTTAASGPTEPTMPAAAIGTDAASAEAFVTFFFATVNYAQTTGDVTGLDALGRKCSGCDAGVQSVTDTYSDGGQIRGGQGVVRKFKTGFVNRDPDDWAVVECTVVTSRQVVDFPGTAHDRRYRPGSTDVRLLLEPTVGAWVVRSLVTR